MNFTTSLLLSTGLKLPFNPGSFPGFDISKERCEKASLDYFNQYLNIFNLLEYSFRFFGQMLSYSESCLSKKSPFFSTIWVVSSVKEGLLVTWPSFFLNSSELESSISILTQSIYRLSMINFCFKSLVFLSSFNPISLPPIIFYSIFLSIIFIIFKNSG